MTAQHAIFENQKIDACAKPSNNDSIQPMYRADDDGSIYAFWCLACNSFWKVYQNRGHTSACPRRITKLQRNTKYWVNRVIPHEAWPGSGTRFRGTHATFVRMKEKGYAYMRAHAWIKGKGEVMKSFVAKIEYQDGIIKKLFGATPPKKIK